MGIQSASKLISERDELQAYQKGSWMWVEEAAVGEQGCFALPQQADMGPRMGKFTNLNVGGWESTTLKEVKEALLLTTHTLPEHVRV